MNFVVVLFFFSLLIKYPRYYILGCCVGFHRRCGCEVCVSRNRDGPFNLENGRTADVRLSVMSRMV